MSCTSAIGFREPRGARSYNQTYSLHTSAVDEPGSLKNYFFFAIDVFIVNSYLMDPSTTFTLLKSFV